MDNVDARNICSLLIICMLSKALIIAAVAYVPSKEIASWLDNGTDDWRHNWRALNITSDNRPITEKLGNTFDSRGYVHISKSGYTIDDSQQNVNLGGDCIYVWPFMYPIFIRIFSFFMDPVVAGLLVSNVASLAAVVLFYMVSSGYVGRDSAYRAGVLFALFPYNLAFWTASFSEPLYAVFVLLCWFFLLRSQLLLCGFFAMLASLTRLPGLMLFPLLSIIYCIMMRHKQGLKDLAVNTFTFNVFCLPILYWMFVQVPQGTGYSLTSLRSICVGDSIFGGFIGIFAGSVFGILFTYFAFIGAYYLKDIDHNLMFYSLSFMAFHIIFAPVGLGVYIGRYIGVIWPLFIYYGHKFDGWDVRFYSVISVLSALLMILLHANQVSWI